MFKSIKHTRYIYHKDTTYLNVYKIIDDDFEEEYIAFTNSDYEDVQAAAAIINCYSSRNLNVAKNLILFMKDRQLKYSDNYSIANQISWYRESIFEFKKYLPEINKYLNLL